MDIISQLKRDEGCRLEAYEDTLGFWTIGYGHCDGEIEDGDVITQEEAETLLVKDIKDATERVAKMFPWAKNLDEVRLAALVNMSFQLGSKIGQFTRSMDCIRDGRYYEAETHLLNSLWAKQTPQRARRVARQIATGEWQ